MQQQALSIAGGLAAAEGKQYKVELKKAAGLCATIREKVESAHLLEEWKEVSKAHPRGASAEAFSAFSDAQDAGEGLDERKGGGPAS